MTAQSLASPLWKLNDMADSFRVLLPKLNRMSPDEYRQAREISPLPGDILLVRGIGAKSTLLGKIQNPLRLLWRPKYAFSHALLCVVNGTFIHSTPNGGVHIISFKSLMKQVTPHWRVIRRIGMEDKVESNFAAFTNRCTYYMAQKYNVSLGALPRLTDSKSFCSELIAKVYRDLGMPVCHLPPHRVYPRHLFRLLERPEWRDVTELYQRPFLYQLLCSDEADAEAATLAKITQDSHEQTRQTIMMHQLLTDYFRIADDWWGKLGMQRRNEKVPLDLGMTFWDADHNITEKQ